MEHIKEYIEEHKDRFLEELFGLIRIPSISSEVDKKEEMTRAAEYWKKSLREAGADRTEIFETPGNPVVYGEKIIDSPCPPSWFIRPIFLTSFLRQHLFS